MDRRKALKSAGLLAGGALTSSVWLGLLQSCQSEPRLDWPPQFFTTDEAIFVSALVDTILPRTDTPGALDVKVDMFMDKVFAETNDAAGRKQAHAELGKLMAGFHDKFGKDFADLDAARRAEVLREVEPKPVRFTGNVWGTTVGEEPVSNFYTSLKGMAQWAYFSTEKIGTEVLSYDPIPGEYIGCMPLSEVGNRWTL